MRTGRSGRARRASSMGSPPCGDAARGWCAGDRACAPLRREPEAARQAIGDGAGEALGDALGLGESACGSTIWRRSVRRSEVLARGGQAALRRRRRGVFASSAAPPACGAPVSRPDDRPRAAAARLVALHRPAAPRALAAALEPVGVEEVVEARPFLVPAGEQDAAGQPDGVAVGRDRPCGAARRAPSAVSAGPTTKPLRRRCRMKPISRSAGRWRVPGCGRHVRPPCRSAAR